ncbi:protein dispatched [Chrysoperla carnea]|uniref:protein dispatched n=1 Tax=Chrysoperla carnea TaxID=189513 RepID=UPI001D0797E8|nr:protein dispatched [Chrysoperla carnea]
MKYFTRIISHHPYIIAFTSFLFSLYCVYSSIYVIPVPNFSDPQLGFETRGTTLSNRYVTWTNLLKELKPSGLLKQFPKINQQIIPNALNRNTKNRNKRNLRQEKPYFCGNPGPDYSKFIVKSSTNSNIFNFKNVQWLCKLQTLIMENNVTKTVCETRSRNDFECCRPWSIDNYVALFNNRSSCSDIMPRDIKNITNMLKKCQKYVHKKHLRPHCYESRKCESFIPHECIQNNIAFNIFFYLMDKQFLQGNDRTNYIDFTSIYLPIAKSEGVLDFFYDLKNRGFQYFDKLEIVAIDFGLKDKLFDESVLNDIKYVIGGVIFVLASIWLYTESLCITVIVIYSIIASLSIAYYIYHEIFLLSFFPFMNILAVVVSIGIGADDAFVFCKFWNAPEYIHISIECKLFRTFQHAIVSIFLTSLTTAIAFYSSMFSSITAIRLFSIFSGTIVVVNFLIMITFFPACVVILQQFKLICNHNRYVNLHKKFIRFYHWHQIYQNCYTNFEQLIVLCIMKLRWFWFTILTLLAAYASFVIWFYGDQYLPNQRDFQWFRNSHIFEQYDFNYKDRFLSEMELMDVYKMPIRFVWGLHPNDNGNYMDPYSLGHLSFDETFDVSHPNSQEWLLNFCKSLKAQPFYLYETGPQFLNCFLEGFIKWMKRRCTDPIEKTDLTPCCREETFPFKRSIFNKCIIDYMDELSQTPSTYFAPNDAGPKFIKSSIAVLIVEFSSNYSYTYSYYEMHQFISSVEKWMQEQLTTAPSTMKNGWFVTDYDFYDLQKSLVNDTYIAMIFSLAFSFIILIVVTGNYLVSIFASFTVLVILQLIIATLILLGWRLNILESIALTSSIGLTVDFSLHYSIGFVLNNKKYTNTDRYKSTKFTLFQMVGPTTMACLTTAFAGLFMLPSQIQPYIQIGTFLIVAMLFSWIYSTFYFCSLLALFGPNNNNYGYCNYKYIRNCLTGRNSSTDYLPEEIPLNFLGNNCFRNRSFSEPNLYCGIPIENKFNPYGSLPILVDRFESRHYGFNKCNETPPHFYV